MSNRIIHHVPTIFDPMEMYVPTIFDEFDETEMQMQNLAIGSRGPACELYFDGACKGNPGTAGIGFLLRYSSGKEIERFSSFLGHQFTNNAAEYKALIAGLQHALDQGITAIKAYGDSELVCRQVNGEYKINKEWLKRYYNTVWQLLRRFESYAVVHVRREMNRDADELANQGVDQRSVDTSPAAQDKVMRRCRTPSDAKLYVLEKRCEGIAQLQFILDTIKSDSPKSYAAVQELCSVIKQEKVIFAGFQDSSQLKHICMCCLLAQY